MKRFLKKNFLVLFISILAFVFYANIVNSLMLHIVFKPLIVISLLVYLFMLDGHKERAVAFAIAGLLLSLLGDILLIFQGENPLFFIGGLISFLIAHIFYIFYYLRSSATMAVKRLKGKSIFILMMIIYGVVFCLLLYNNLGSLKVPVFLYTTVLIGMNVFALNRYGKVSDISFKLIMTGAVCFALSDSLLAINKFLLPIPLAGVWILGSYAAAQYFITQGVLSKK
ncbi:MAG: lysoplasmalogenase [Bacteroidetes bacterium]|nr:lysoplasmalogenase [Bacteroidota bacterium]